jgi:BirA family biotin operon repressor/biotin-[acetyl-CoA-carboxylase] ligase
VTSRDPWLIHRYDSVASTMEPASYLACFGAPERTVVVSAEQTAGRGRAGRSWSAPAGTALFCTIILRPRVEPPRLASLPLIAGVAVAEAIETLTTARVRLKWPNDVWMAVGGEDRKVAGILVASSLRGAMVEHVLVGIGVNVSTPSDALPAGATSLAAATGRVVTSDEVLAALLDRFDHAYDGYVAADGRPSLDAWRDRAALIGEPVIVADAGQHLSGIALGIDDDGALLLEQPGGHVRRVVAGDLVRGPRRDQRRDA